MQSGAIDYAGLVKQHGSQRAAAAAIGMSKSGLQWRMAAAKAASPTEPARETEASDPMQAMMASIVESQKMMARLLAKRETKEAKAPAVEKVAKAPKPEKPRAGGTLAVPESKERRAHGNRWILTSAQNNTHVHERLLAAFLVYCEHNSATLLVAPFTYNKNAWENGARVTTESDGVSYDESLEPYMCRHPIRLAKDFIFCADYDRLPTSADPLSGIDNYTRESSGAFPHAKVAVKSCATMKNAPSKMLYTTGTLTQRNYIQRAAGKRAEFSHTFAGLLVEVDDDGTWFARQLLADDNGDFSDLDEHYTAEGVTKSDIEAITWFDIHIEKAPEALLAMCFDGKGSILDTLKPRQQFIHDVTDFEARNHHNIKSPYHLARMRNRGTETVEGNIQKSAEFLARIERTWCNTVVVESNHDQAFPKWLELAEGHSDPANAEYWHRWNVEVFKAIREERQGYLPFEAAVREKVDLQHTMFLPEDQSYIICPDFGGGIENVHGHRGANGAKGSPKAYRGMGIRVTRGDSHTAGWDGGTVTVGASASEMGYNKGLSGWSVTFALTFGNSKRSMITIRDGKYRVPRAAPPAAEKPRYRVRATSQQMAG